ncbi:MAG TPA: hypothetical protein VM900_09785, partial [Sphingomonas sp.]|nr:hypothetical protein [Sphingomonas sp.]
MIIQLLTLLDENMAVGWTSRDRWRLGGSAATRRAMAFFPRATASVLALSLALPIAGQAAAQVRKPRATAAKPAKPSAVAVTPKVNTSAWLYKGSDLPPDPAWSFGTLENGLRYAVRRNGVPPGQVSIRVRIDAGSLYEADRERGYA